MELKVKKGMEMLCFMVLGFTGNFYCVNLFIYFVIYQITAFRDIWERAGDDVRSSFYEESAVTYRVFSYSFWLSSKGAHQPGCTFKWNIRTPQIDGRQMLGFWFEQGYRHLPVGGYGQPSVGDNCLLPRCYAIYLLFDLCRERRQNDAEMGSVLDDVSSPVNRINISERGREFFSSLLYIRCK